MAADSDRRVPPDELAANRAERNDIGRELSDGVGLTTTELIQDAAGSAMQLPEAPEPSMPLRRVPGMCWSRQQLLAGMTTMP
jgi:hypothetical protein